MTSVIEAITLIDALIGVPTPEQTHRDTTARNLGALCLTLPEASAIQTKGCGRCGGTMYRTVDHNGSGSPYVCSNLSCGAVE